MREGLIDLESIKNAYKGERCFVLGTGSSILEHDLLKLKGEYSFAVNFFPLHPHFKEIAPAFYCMRDTWAIDSEIGRDVMARVGEFKDMLKFLDAPAVGLIDELNYKNQPYYLLKSTGGCVWKSGVVNLDIVDGVDYGGGVVTDFCFPLLFFMGFSKIYLLGCDLTYDLEAPSNKARPYFYDIPTPAPPIPDYAKWLAEQTKVQIKSFRVFKWIFKAEDIEIYNAGIGGNLDVFPRVDYDSLFE